MNELYQEMTDVILEKIVNCNKEGTDLKFKQVLSLEIHLTMYEPLRGSSHIPLPPELSKKKATINMKNEDDQCFIMWSVTRALNIVDNHPEHIDINLIKATEKYNRDGITFPVNLGQINKFDKQSPTISVNILGYEKKNVNVLRKSENYKRENVVDLFTNK